MPREPSSQGPCPVVTEVVPVSLARASRSFCPGGLLDTWAGGRAALSLLFWSLPAAPEDVAWALSSGRASGGGRLVGGISPPLLQAFLLRRASLCFETDVKSRAAGGRGPAPGPRGRRNRDIGYFTVQTGGWSHMSSHTLQGMGQGPVAHQSIQDSREGFRGRPGPTLPRRRIPRPAGASERLESWPSWA